MTSTPQKRVCPECGREAEVLYKALATGKRDQVWAYHDANPPQRALCPASTKRVAEHPPLPEITNPAEEDHTTIDVLFAFIAEDADGEEGIIAIRTQSGVMPLVGADLDRMGSLIPHAEVAARMRNKPVKLVLFGQPTVLDTIQPEA